MHQGWPPWEKLSWKVESIQDFQALEFPSLDELISDLGAIWVSRWAYWWRPCIPVASGYGSSSQHLHLDHRLCLALCVITVFSKSEAPASGHFERLTLLCFRWQPPSTLRASREASMGQIPPEHTCAFMHHSLLAAFSLSSSSLVLFQSLTFLTKWLTPEWFVWFITWSGMPAQVCSGLRPRFTSSACVVPDVCPKWPLTSKRKRKSRSRNGLGSK